MPRWRRSSELVNIGILSLDRHVIASEARQSLGNEIASALACLEKTRARVVGRAACQSPLPGRERTKGEGGIPSARHPALCRGTLPHLVQKMLAPAKRLKSPG
jgi:hypothetical protein